jgi:hypothetical protein
MRLVMIFLCATVLPICGAAQTSTANDVIRRIQQRYPAPVADTVDTVKAGDPATPVTGIATTFLDTMEVLREANRRGLNLVITHEPTFYNHRDNTTFFSSDPVYQEKLAFIEQHHMVVFRLHDEIHGTAPDHIAQGLIEALGWQSYTTPNDPFHATIPPTSLAALAKQIQAKLKANTLRVVGDPNLVITHVALRRRCDRKRWSCSSPGKHRSGRRWSMCGTRARKGGTRRSSCWDTKCPRSLAWKNARKICA